MSHLSPSELVDLLDGLLAPARAAHAECCESCRAQCDELRRTLGESAAAGIPEPSPMFWDHLSARIREDIAQTTGPGGSRSAWLQWSPRSALAALAAVLIAAMAAWSLLPRQAAVEERPATGLAATQTPRDDAEAERAWALVNAAAEQAGWEDVEDAGLSARPGSAEGAILDMSDAERVQLIRLLEEELKRSGA
jgi:hypothetical protein